MAPSRARGPLARPGEAQTPARVPATAAGRARGDGARSLLRSPRGGAGEGREQGAEGRLAVFAATDHLYLVLFGDPQAHDADQAVDAGHLPGEVQFGLAGKALRGLA